MERPKGERTRLNPGAASYSDTARRKTGVASHSPSPILGAAVDIGAIFQKMPNNVEPASGTRFMQGTVTCIVSVVHVTDFVFQAIQDNFLWGEEMGCVDCIKKTTTTRNEGDGTIA